MRHFWIQPVVLSFSCFTPWQWELRQPSSTGSQKIKRTPQGTRSWRFASAVLSLQGRAMLRRFQQGLPCIQTHTKSASNTYLIRPENSSTPLTETWSSSSRKTQRPSSIPHKLSSSIQAANSQPSTSPWRANSTQKIWESFWQVSWTAIWLRSLTRRQPLRTWVHREVLHYFCVT